MTAFYADAAMSRGILLLSSLTAWRRLRAARWKASTFAIWGPGGAQNPHITTCTLGFCALVDETGFSCTHGRGSLPDPVRLAVCVGDHGIQRVWVQMLLALRLLGLYHHVMKLILHAVITGKFSAAPAVEGLKPICQRFKTAIITDLTFHADRAFREAPARPFGASSGSGMASTRQRCSFSD